MLGLGMLIIGVLLLAWGLWARQRAQEDERERVWRGRREDTP